MKIIDEDAATCIARFGQQSILADIDIIVHSSELYLLFGSLYLLTKLKIIIWLHIIGVRR